MTFTFGLLTFKFIAGCVKVTWLVNWVYEKLQLAYNRTEGIENLCIK